MNHDKSSLNEIQYPILKIMDEATQAQRSDKFHEQAKFWFNTNPIIIRELLTWIYQNKAQLHLPSTDGQNPALTILDPFMGFGTVLKEAQALDSVPIGIEINPVSWFFAHAEMEKHDLKTISSAFRRLAKRKTWHGTPLQEELLSYYKTACPCEKNHPEKAEVVRLFWIQTDMCSNPTCQKRIPLFEDFIIYQKKMTVNYYPDASCSSCKQKFDWDSDLVTLIVETNLMVNGLQDAAGIDRGAKLWAYGENSVKCPTCQNEMTKSQQLPSPAQKKVLLSVLFCPYCQTVWQYRGNLPQNVRCPSCRSAYYPREGNVQRDWYTCPFCGSRDKVQYTSPAEAAEKRIPVLPFALEGYCAYCHQQKNQTHDCLLHQTGGRFFKKISTKDFSHFLTVSQLWGEQQQNLDFPVSEIVSGKETRILLEHQYFYWFQLFNARQLLSLATLLRAISEESDKKSRQILLTAFLLTLESNNIFTVFDRKRHRIKGIFDEKPFIVPYRYTEGNLWGIEGEEGSFSYHVAQLKQRLKSFQADRHEQTASPIPGFQNNIWCSSISSQNLQNYLPPVDVIVSEIPPPIDTLFMEWSDFYYVWLRLALKNEYTFFNPEHVHRIENINFLDRSRAKTNKYFAQLKEILRKCSVALKPEGLALFILPDQRESFWPALTETIFQAGFTVDFIWPVSPAMPASSSLPRAGFDKVILGCRNLEELPVENSINWKNSIISLQQVLQNEFSKFQAGNDDPRKSNQAFQRFILLGQGFREISKIYKILQKSPFPIRLRKLFQLVYLNIDRVLHPENGLPEILFDMDPISYFYFAYLCPQTEINSTELAQISIGICEIESLIQAGLIIPSSQKAGRSYQINDPIGRYEILREQYINIWQQSGIQTDLFLSQDPLAHLFPYSLVDVMHLLIGLVFYGETIHDKIPKWKFPKELILETGNYLIKREVPFSDLVSHLINKM